MNQSVPDATEHTHQALIELMKADASRQEPLTSVIGAMLEETVIRNDMKQKQSSLPSFTGRRPPLTASAFVARIAKYSGASPCCYAIGLIYLERMKKRDTGLYLNSTNFQRLFLISTMTAAKFLDDFYYSNKHWAQIGGITTQEINRLELEFLFRMGFSLHMQREEYDWYAEELLSRVGSSPSSAPAITVGTEKEQEQTAEICPQVAKAAAAQNQYQPAARSTGSSAEDMDSFLSTQTTPKTSSSHMPLAHEQVQVRQGGGMPYSHPATFQPGVPMEVHKSMHDANSGAGHQIVMQHQGMMMAGSGYQGMIASSGHHGIMNASTGHPGVSTAGSHTGMMSPSQGYEGMTGGGQQGMGSSHAVPQPQQPWVYF